MTEIKKKVKEQLFYKVIIKGKDGKVITTQKGEAHSFLKAYNQLLAASMGAGGQTIKDTGGTDRTSGTSYNNFNLNAGIGTVVQGIRVGTGTTAVAIDDYAMGTAIVEGTASGQLEHQAVTFDADVTVSDPNLTHELKRIIINGSGATITVKEIGIYVRMVQISAWYACIVRDVITDVPVPDGGTITVIYTWKISE